MSPEVALFAWLIFVAVALWSIWRPHRRKSARTPSAEYESRVIGRYAFLAVLRAPYGHYHFDVYASRRSNATRAAERKAEQMFNERLMELKEV